MNEAKAKGKINVRSQKQDQHGSTPKKAGKGIEDMREEMKDDPETLKKFNDTYANKDDKKAFFKACKIYSDWAKAQKKAK